jgi:hypothetical protein
VTPDRGEQRRHVRLAETPAVSAEAPFDPHQGNAKQQQGNEVRDHERAAAIAGGLDRKTQEVTEPHGIAGHRQNQSNAGAPSFGRVTAHADGSLK